MSVKKKLIICAVTIFGTLALINILWFSLVWRQYNGYKEKMGQNMKTSEEGMGTKYIVENDKYAIALKCPSYLKFTGGGYIRVNDIEPYAITYDDEGNETSNRETDVTLYIWPELFGKYTMGVQFTYDNGDKMCFVNIDNDLNILTDNEMDKTYNEEMEEMMQDNYDRIEEMYEFAVEILELDI